MAQMDVVIIINEIIWLGIGLGIINRGVEEGMKEKYRSMRKNVSKEEERRSIRREVSNRKREVKEEEVRMNKRELW
jgi:hypothetical protein